MTLVNPKRTAAHLSSDRHVPCELQRWSDTRREVSPKTFSQQIEVHAFLLRSAEWCPAVQESQACRHTQISWFSSRDTINSTLTALSVDVPRYKVPTYAKGSMLKESSQICTSALVQERFKQCRLEAVGSSQDFRNQLPALCLRRIRNDVLCRKFPSSGPTSTKKDTWIFPHDGQILFLSLLQHGAVLTLEKTQKTRLVLGDPVAEVRLFLHRVVSSATSFVLLCPFLWTFSCPVTNHTTAVTFRSQQQLLHFRAEFTRRRS